MVQSLFSIWEPFVFSLGLIASEICCVGDFQRSRSRRPLLRRFYRHHGEDEEAPPRSPLPRRRAEADIRSQRSPLSRRRSSNLLHSTDPPSTVYSGNPTDISGTSTAHNRNILSRSRSPIVRRPIILRSQSLPKLRRRRHHRTKRSEAPISSHNS